MYYIFMSYVCMCAFLCKLNYFVNEIKTKQKLDLQT